MCDGFGGLRESLCGKEDRFGVLDGLSAQERETSHSNSIAHHLGYENISGCPDVYQKLLLVGTDGEASRTH